jgi:hypothetical protein
MGLSWQQRPPGSGNQVPLSHRTGMGGTFPDEVPRGADCLEVLHEVSAERARQRAAEDALNHAYWRMAKGVASPIGVAACLLVASAAVSASVVVHDNDEPALVQVESAQVLPYFQPDPCLQGYCPHLWGSS